MYWVDHPRLARIAGLAVVVALLGMATVFAATLGIWLVVWFAVSFGLFVLSGHLFVIVWLAAWLLGQMRVITPPPALETWSNGRTQQILVNVVVGNLVAAFTCTALAGGISLLSDWIH
jgi:hypothetical protein